MLARARHRVRQFAGALRPHVGQSDRDGAYPYLSPTERTLFESMTLRDQRHGLDVFLRVRAAAPAEDTRLFAAALLHDCGKGPVRLWHRVAFVMLRAGAPWLLARIAAERGAAWRRALWRILHHPALGAAMAAAAGADADVVRLIKEQDAAAPDRRLALLQAADEA